MSDRFDLERFVSAQAGVFERAIGEIAGGRKTSHWMWFIFPQIEGLGTSAMARRYAIRSLDEARAYLAHPILGPRLRDSVAALQALPASPGRTAAAVLGGIDAVKLRSSLTLFVAAGAGAAFEAALERWFGGSPDAATLARLEPEPTRP